MNNSVQNLLRKINFIEAEVEIQKQILFSIPTDQKQEMERTIKKIAEAKSEIEQLRAQIARTSPSEYAQILKFEEATVKFKAISAEKKFQKIENMTTEEKCTLHLINGTELPCLIKAIDEDGNWTVITMEGEIRHFDKKEVAWPGGFEFSKF